MRPNTSGSCAAERQGRGGFTLIELLVVILLIGLLAGIAVPYLGGLNKASAMDAAVRQMLDDVTYARNRAISGHTTVYMVFLPPEFWKNPAQGFSMPGTPDDLSSTNAYELIAGQCTTYALYSPRGIGDQPGRPYPRYLTGWRSLPDGVLIETNKFFQFERIADANDATRSFDVYPFATNYFPFPAPETAESPSGLLSLPYIAFDPQGRLTSRTNELIPLAHGSIFFPQKNDDWLDTKAPDIQIPNYREAGRTNYNLIHSGLLTGRAKAERIQLK